MNDYIELRSVIATVLRRWWLVVLGALVFGAAGYFISSSQTSVYRATTSLFVGRPIASAELNRFDIQNSLQLAQIYADIAQRQPVLERTVEELGLDTSWRQLRSRVKTQVSNDTQLLDIGVEADSPEEAVAIADEIARQLILMSPNGMHDPDREQAKQFTRQQLEQLQNKIEEGQARLEDLEKSLLVETKPDKLESLQGEILALDNMIARWESNYAELLKFVDEGQPANNLAVLEPAQAALAPVRPKVRFNTLIAAMVGMALAIGLIFLREFLDDTLKTPAEIERLLGLRTVGAINRLKGKTPSDLLVVNHDPFSFALEDYRLLRTKVQFMYRDDKGYSVMVTSAEQGTGKSLTVANLGIVMAQAGMRTIIVDANLRQPMIHQFFQLSNQEGLTHLLRGGEQDVARYLSPTMVPNLKVLVSGSLPQNPAELLGSQRMRQVLNNLAETADVILCDSPEAVTVADASVLSSQVDGVLAVIDAGKTNRNAAAQMVANLHDAHANILGVVLNRIPSKNRLVIFSEIVQKTNTASPSRDEDLATFSYIESVGN